MKGEIEMSKLTVKVSAKQKNGTESWEGTVSLPGARPTKLTRKSDNSTSFSTRSAVNSAAQRFAETYGFSGIEAPVAKATTVKKAAKKKAATTKKSTAKKASKKSTSNSTPASTTGLQYTW
jgi:hypothetical protein